MPPHRHRPDWLGPLLRYELIVATRRGQHAAMRCIAAGVLLIVLMTAYGVHIRTFDLFHPFQPTPELLPREQAAFANWFANACMFVQLIGILIMTPAAVADAVARDKERRTLEFLFTTELTDREIIFGKLGARLAYLLGVLLTGLPILALTQLFGGVEIRILAAQYIFLISTLFIVGAISMFSSVTAARVTSATFAAYAGTIAYALLGACCMSWSLAAHFDWTTPIWLSLINFIGGAVLVSASVIELRPRAVRLPVHSRAPRPSLPLTLAREDLYPLVRRHSLPGVIARSRRPPLPPVFDRHPLLWKEVFLQTAAWGGDSPSGAIAGSVILPILIGAVIVIVLTVDKLWRNPAAFGEVTRAIVSIFTILIGGVMGLLALRHTTNSVIRERENDTLGSLLLLPCRRERILEAKWLAAFVGWWPLLAILAAIIVLGWLTGGISLVRAVVLVLAVVAPLEFLSSLGLWISVTSATSLRANLAAVLCLLLVSVGPLVIANIIELTWPVRGQFDPGFNALVMTATMPPVAWSQTTLGSDGAGNPSAETLHAVLYGALAYSIGAWVLWRAARRRFNRLVA